MASADCAARAAEQSDQRVTRLDRTGSGAGLTRAAGFVHFSRGNAGDADVWSFGAPDRTVAIIDVGWCAGECLAGGDNSCGKGE
jgi:hypothetical protein